MSLRAALALIMVASAAEAKPGTPGPAYFAGVYERIGRDAAAKLQNDRVMVRAVGQGVVIAGCQDAPLRMNFGPAFEINNLMTGAQAGVSVECLFHNNGYNRPILTCRAKDGAAFTLWPVQDDGLSCES